MAAPLYRPVVFLVWGPNEEGGVAWRGWDSDSGATWVRSEVGDGGRGPPIDGREWRGGASCIGPLGELAYFAIARSWPVQLLLRTRLENGYRPKERKRRERKRKAFTNFF